MPASDLLAYLADELHAPPGDPGLAGSVRRVLRPGLRESSPPRPSPLARGRRGAPDRRPGRRSRPLLASSLNFDLDGLRPTSRLLIVWLALTSCSPSPPSLADRLTARVLLDPLIRSESSSYVLGRLSAAGRLASPSSTPRPLAALHRAAEGLPPRRLQPPRADLALLIAYAEGLGRPDARAVEVAAREAASEPIGV